ncbi:hypothetical protein EV385_6678 [Krasilnikovia cinnamomea]|uniref:Uncharacterized protein n=1 Tax=Krasilnikovia cinnamomea TaxID=349313 RepID=A0A4Q7Z9R2_9ACTN|nr:hypothetical protein [Krasilnikovia cinnamomea]RZU46603.1 hypothetical protein EV385_6678 [Krasilnikovia cinnamomea]
MTDPANPQGYVGGWVLFATRCGHPLAYAYTESGCTFFWHDFDHGSMTGPSVDTERHSATRLATQDDLDVLRRGDSCELCSLDTTPRPTEAGEGEAASRSPVTV